MMSDIIAIAIQIKVQVWTIISFVAILLGFRILSKIKFKIKQ